MKIIIITWLIAG